MENRLILFDFLKFIAMLVVIQGHLIENVNKDALSNDNFILLLGLSWNMPLFMIMSGYFSTRSLNNNTFKELTRKKFHQLILPCLTWFFTATIFYSFLLYTTNKQWQSILNFDNFIYCFWFFKCLFSCYLIAWIVKRICKHDIIASILSTSILIIIPYGSLWGVNYLLPFFWIGYFINKYDFSKKLNNYIFTICVIIFVISLINYSHTYTVYFSPMAFWKDDYHINTLALYAYVYRFIIGLTGSIVLIKISQWLCKHWASNKVFIRLCILGKYTLGTYIIQTYLVQYPRYGKFFRDINSDVFNLVISIAFSFIIYLVCYICIKIMERYTWINKFFLGHYK